MTVTVKCRGWVAEVLLGYYRFAVLGNLPRAQWPCVAVSCFRFSLCLCPGACMSRMYIVISVYLFGSKSCHQRPMQPGRCHRTGTRRDDKSLSVVIVT